MKDIKQQTAQITVLFFTLTLTVLRPGFAEEKAATAEKASPSADAAATSSSATTPQTTGEPKGASTNASSESSPPVGNATATEAAVPASTDTASSTSSTEEEVIEDVEPEVVEKKGVFPSEFDGESAVGRDRGINILTARPVRKKSLMLIIDHRPYQGLASGQAEDVFFDYLGFDSGNLKIGIGLRYGIIEGLDVGFSRINDGRTVAYDTYEFNARYAFLRQKKHQIDASIMAGASWFVQKDRQDAAGGFAQLFIDRVFFDMLLVGVGFGFHSESSSDEKAQTDNAFSGAVLGVIEWRMIERLALCGEIAANVFGYGEKWPAFSLALKILTTRHVFSLMLTNTQFMLSDGIVTNSWRGASDWVFGFQIAREFSF